jgi:hypothetical protein
VPLVLAGRVQVPPDLRELPHQQDEHDKAGQADADPGHGRAADSVEQHDDAGHGHQQDEQVTAPAAVHGGRRR